MTVKTASKIGFQHVGSFLRPNVLKQARKDFADKTITQADLTAVENEAIKDLVNKEVEVGLDYATDGEFRRSYWHLDFFWGFALNIFITEKAIILLMKKLVMIPPFFLARLNLTLIIPS